ncbi:MAG: hypothetical protein ACYDBI_06035 [Thermoplasmataceae archaeon]
MAAARRRVSKSPPGRIVWAPQEGPQTLLLQCPVEDILFGGARGGGKSDGLLGDFVSHAGESRGKAKGIIFRRTTPQLEDLILRSAEIYPSLGARWIAGVKTWLFPCGSFLRMRWMDRDDDADSYQGHSYTWVGFDELGNWPSPMPIDKIRATLRSPHGIPCVSRSSANPGGLGHIWINERYIQSSPPLRPFYDESRKVWRVFIPSNVRDNKKLLEADPGYIDRLKSSGPPWLVRAWLEGDWSASASDSFFMQDALLVDGAPVEWPSRCDQVYAVMDTALKDQAQHDGTAVTFFARSKYGIGPPLIVLDWDVIQIKASLLEDFLPTVKSRLEEMAMKCRSRQGSVGTWIEDKGSGTVLLQKTEKTFPIPETLVSLGKEGRALAVSNHIYGGKVKLSKHAFEKVTHYRDEYKNHFLSQICGFRLGHKTPHGMDLLDTFTYGCAIALGNSEGY